MTSLRLSGIPSWSIVRSEAQRPSLSKMAPDSDEVAEHLLDEERVALGLLVDRACSSGSASRPDRALIRASTSVSSSPFRDSRSN